MLQENSFSPFNYNCNKLIPKKKHKICVCQKKSCTFVSQRYYIKIYEKNTLSDIQLVVTSEHTFNPTIRTLAKRERILYGDSCLFTINHDCLTSIELFYRDYYGGGRYSFLAE